MTKKLLLIILCLSFVLPLFNGCSSNLKFESEAEMLENLEGLWYDNSNAKYYLFREGKLYCTTQVDLENQWKEWMYSLLDTSGAKSWDRLTYENALKYNVADKALKEKDFTAFPEKGKLILDKGSKKAITISVEEGRLITKQKGEKYKGYFKPLKDSTPFSSEKNLNYFNEIRTEILETYKLETKNYLISTKEFARLIERNYPEIKEYTLYSEEGGSKIYKSTSQQEWFGNKGSLVISDSLYTVGIDAYYGKKLTALFSQESQVLLSSDQPGANLETLVGIATATIKNIPGALTKEELMTRFQSGAKMENGNMIFSEEIGAIKYTVIKTKDSQPFVQLMFDSVIPLKDCVQPTK